MLQHNNITVWRFHDYIHRHNPDIIRMGVITDLDWGKYYDEKPQDFDAASNSTERSYQNQGCNGWYSGFNQKSRKLK